MESYLPISYINDFIFCPRSIYFHGLYGGADESLYHTTDQSEGRAAHKSVDNKKYTTSKDIFQGIEVYSSRYGICGKIDTFDNFKGLLVERKKKIKTVYDGYIYQLYAQYHCLSEMGYTVKSMGIYSMDDNKNYPISLPSEDLIRQKEFENIIYKIKTFDLFETVSININKCKRCIYSSLCDIGEA